LTSTVDGLATAIEDQQFIGDEKIHRRDPQFVARRRGTTGSTS